MDESFAQYETLEHYETVLKHIHDGVYTLDANGQITWVNETAVKEFDIGFSREELIGAPVSIVLKNEDIQKCLEIIQDCLQDPERDSGRCEIALQTADGREIPCDLHLALLPFEDGEFQGTVGVVRDISHRKRREQQLEVQNRVLRHNLRNDMTVILGRAKRLATSVPEENRKDIREILKVAQRLFDLSEKVRSIAKIQASAAEDQLTINLTHRIRTLLDKYRSEYPSVTFEFENAAENALEKRVSSEELLDLAVENLIENSIKHNDSVHPMVSVTLESEADRCFIRIEDNGPGLPEMEREVLERGSETELQHSSGVGLWLVHWSITELGGEIRFEGGPQSGTVVILRIPL